MMIKVGDSVVVCCARGSLGSHLKGEEGVARYVDNASSDIMVEFNREVIFGHSWGGRGKAGCCWWLPSESLELLVITLENE